MESRRNSSSRDKKVDGVNGMEECLIEVLTQFGHPVIRQGSLHENEAYPATFFTFWNKGSTDHAHYDNISYGTAWGFDVNVYSSDPEKTYDLLGQVRDHLLEEGWIVPGKGYDVASDEPTHTGRGMEVYYIEF